MVGRIAKPAAGFNEGVCRRASGPEGLHVVSYPDVRPASPEPFGSMTPPHHRRRTSPVPILTVVPPWPVALEQGGSRRPAASPAATD